jgi:hypothetical protein
MESTRRDAILEALLLYTTAPHRWIFVKGDGKGVYGQRRRLRDIAQR